MGVEQGELGLGVGGDQLGEGQGSWQRRALCDLQGQQGISWMVGPLLVPTHSSYRNGFLNKQAILSLILTNILGLAARGPVNQIWHSEAWGPQQTAPAPGKNNSIIRQSKRLGKGNFWVKSGPLTPMKNNIQRNMD